MEQSSHAEVIKTIEEMLNFAGFEYESVKVVELAGQIIYSIETKDPRMLIGNHGDTVHAIDFLVKRIVEKYPNLTKESDPTLFLVDVNNYRSKQIKELETKALVMAERARSFQYDVELSPMSSYERLIIHTVLANSPSIKTESLGEGKSRRVVIKYTTYTAD